MNTAREFDGLRMLVTGGASGIGHAIATNALARGASVAVLDLDPSTSPDGAAPFHADVSDDESVVRAVDDATRRSPSCWASATSWCA